MNKITSCSLKCPCRRWVNCQIYVDETRKSWRILQKERDPEIQEYYNRFGIDWNLSDFVMSG